MALVRDKSANSGGSRGQVALLIARATMLAYPELLPELAGRLERRGYRAVLSVLEHEGDVDSALHHVAGVGIVGVIAAALPSLTEVFALEKAGLPLLLYNCFTPSVRANVVSCNHRECGWSIAMRLIDAGHRRFGIISSPADSLVGRERVAGAVEALEQRRAREILIEPGDFSYESGQDALDRIFARVPRRPTAIIAANDAMAIGAMERARALDIRVPRQISFVGFDGIGIARWPAYQLTTMRQPLRRMAEAAAAAIADRIEHPDHQPETRLFAGELIVGKSARLERPVPTRVTG
ncbi:substrate-binding domain-containing protein [Sandaracinobacteroides saxicola]|uniref:Substrate-binding domain-containing protein n=1 Tax=Sandaracinobacteroides saxicola TaxID=2759707 RepID=A0A7G5IFA6_9SPHN|nr:substrate-binding domain-containing protein [Sandaracinobacteroides saxicola]QMW22048.1 substrate-binding domain-containing protein [Sandaracinobacteroides saxicola]